MIDFKKIIDCTYVMGMGPPGGGRNPITERVKRLCNIVGYVEMDEASQKIAEITAHLGAKDIGIIATIPGSTSRAMIELTMQRFADLAPMIALTKLDECETTATEFSAYVEQGARVSILSGTKSVIGASIFASENILLHSNF